MNTLLEQAIQRQDTWLGHDNPFLPQRAANVSQLTPHALASGYPLLDDQLCRGGWPLGNTIELLSDGHGLGAMGLFLPAMTTLSEQGRWQCFIDAPYTPYAPLLDARGIDSEQVLLVHPRSREDKLWSIEQALRSTTCSAVFAWLGADNYRYADLRKLQLAAADSDVLCVLFRPHAAADSHSPATLRLQVTGYKEVQIIKQRGGRQQLPVDLREPDDAPVQPELWELPSWPPAGQAHAAVLHGS